MSNWVACSAKEFGPVGEVRHLATDDPTQTVCGATASHADCWRRNTTKPKCALCERAALSTTEEADQ